MSISLQLTGKKFGKLLIVKRIGSDKNGKALWQALCKCGNGHKARTSDLTSGKIVSCGCFRAKVLKTHGYSGERIYNIWHNMISRTKYRNKYYSDKGVVIESRWKNFLNFRKDLVKSYEEHVKVFGELNTTLDRINPFGNYERKNVRWATKKEQSNNTRRNQVSLNLL